MNLIKENQYLIIPAAQKFECCDFLLTKLFELVAKEKGYKNGKSYFKKEFGASSNATKNMTKREMCQRAVTLPRDKFPSKDEYRYIKKIDTAIYGKAIPAVIKEFAVNVYSGDGRNNPKYREFAQDLIEYIKKWILSPETYQQALCHPVFTAYKTVETDIETANCINRSVNTKDIYEALIKQLSSSELEIKP